MASRLLTVCYHCNSTNPGRSCPVIRLQGLWLEKLGFGIGCKVEVKENYGKLVIKLIKPCD